MKFDDAVLGGLFLLFGLAIVVVASGYETLRHIAYGPRFFPNLIGSGLMACGAILIVRRFLAGDLDARRLITLGPWSRSLRSAIGFAFLPISVVIYVLAVDKVGFFLTMTLLLAVQIGWFTRRPKRSLVIALGMTVLIQEFFQGFMSVPLPWGLLEPLAGVMTWM